MSEYEESVDDVSEENNEESNSDQEFTEEESERQRIRENLSSLSFEELLGLKEKLGSKVYSETVYGTKAKKAKGPKEMKRANKNRPREISSKIRQKQLKALLGNHSKPVPKPSRDPRFDPICGEFDKDTFKQNYQFVNEIRQKEKKQLQTELQECTDPERKNTIMLLIQRIDNQLREEQKINKKKQQEENEKKEIKEQLKRGEKPVFKKKSVRRLEGLVEKYEELKKTNRLQKHIQKRAKKLKLKDKKIKEKGI